MAMRVRGRWRPAQRSGRETCLPVLGRAAHVFETAAVSTVRVRSLWLSARGAGQCTPFAHIAWDWSPGWGYSRNGRLLFLVLFTEKLAGKEFRGFKC